MIIWALALAILCTAAGFLLGLVARRNVRTEPVWRRPADGQVVASRAGDSEAQGEDTAQKVYVGDAGAAIAQSNSTKELRVDSNYCWVVICKNNPFHHPNTFNVHRIPPGETDTVGPRPSMRKPFAVRCDECGGEYTYKPSEVLRYEMDVPSSFVPHPLFRD
jgi:hypothetical protein